MKKEIKWSACKPVYFFICSVRTTKKKILDIFAPTSCSACPLPNFDFLLECFLSFFCFPPLPLSLCSLLLRPYFQFYFGCARFAIFLIASIRKSATKGNTFIRLPGFIFPICVLFHHKHQCVRETNQKKKRWHKSKKTLLPTERKNVQIPIYTNICAHTHTHIHTFEIWKFPTHEILFATHATTTTTTTVIKQDLIRLKTRNCLFQNFQHHSNWCDCATTNRKI